MSLKEAAEMRCMPFLKRGMRADMDGKPGIITGGNSAHLRMRFDGQKHSSVVHPTWQMTFYRADGTIVADYKITKKDSTTRHTQDEISATVAKAAH
jgi:hypothetical protein